MDYSPLILESTKEISKTSPSLKPSPSKITQEFSGTVLENEVFHIILEKEVQKMGYGNITVNVELKDGVVLLKSLNLVTNKRTRY